MYGNPGWREYYYHTPIIVIKECLEYIYRRYARGWLGTREMAAFKAYCRTKLGRKFDGTDKGEAEYDDLSHAERDPTSPFFVPILDQAEIDAMD